MDYLTCVLDFVTVEILLANEICKSVGNPIGTNTILDMIMPRSMQSWTTNTLSIISRFCHNRVGAVVIERSCN